MQANNWLKRMYRPQVEMKVRKNRPVSENPTPRDEGEEGEQLISESEEYEQLVQPDLDFIVI